MIMADKSWRDNDTMCFRHMIGYTGTKSEYKCCLLTKERDVKLIPLKPSEEMETFRSFLLWFPILILSLSPLTIAKFLYNKTLIFQHKIAKVNIKVTKENNSANNGITLNSSELDAMPNLNRIVHEMGSDKSVTISIDKVYINVMKTRLICVGDAQIGIMYSLYKLLFVCKIFKGMNSRIYCGRNAFTNIMHVMLFLVILIPLLINLTLPFIKFPTLYGIYLSLTVLIWVKVTSLSILIFFNIISFSYGCYSIDAFFQSSKILLGQLYMK